MSKYVERIFVEELKSLDLYKKKEYKNALEEAFRKVDEKIISSEGAKYLRSLRENSDMY